MFTNGKTQKELALEKQKKEANEAIRKHQFDEIIKILKKAIITTDERSTFHKTLSQYKDYFRPDDLVRFLWTIFQNSKDLEMSAYLIVGGADLTLSIAISPTVNWSFKNEKDQDYKGKVENHVLLLRYRQFISRDLHNKILDSLLIKHPEFIPPLQYIKSNRDELVDSEEPDIDPKQALEDLSNKLRELYSSREGKSKYVWSIFKIIGLAIQGLHRGLLADAREDYKCVVTLSDKAQLPTDISFPLDTIYLYYQGSHDIVVEWSENGTICRKTLDTVGKNAIIPLVSFPNTGLPQIEIRNPASIEKIITILFPIAKTKDISDERLLIYVDIGRDDIDAFQISALGTEDEGGTHGVTDYVRKEILLCGRTTAEEFVSTFIHESTHFAIDELFGNPRSYPYEMSAEEKSSWPIQATPAKIGYTNYDNFQQTIIDPFVKSITRKDLPGHMENFIIGYVFGYRLILISEDNITKYNIPALKKISESENNSPILIRDSISGDIRIFGKEFDFVNKQWIWGCKPLDKGVFSARTISKFPAVGTAKETLTYYDIDYKIYQEIYVKKGHEHSCDIKKHREIFSYFVQDIIDNNINVDAILANQKHPKLKLICEYYVNKIFHPIIRHYRALVEAAVERRGKMLEINNFDNTPNFDYFNIDLLDPSCTSTLLTPAPFPIKQNSSKNLNDEGDLSKSSEVSVFSLMKNTFVFNKKPPSPHSRADRFEAKFN